MLERWKAPVAACGKGLVEGFIPPEPSYRFDHSHAWGGTQMCIRDRGMSVQIQSHFDTLVEMRLIQVRNILLALPPEEVEVMDDTAKAEFAEMTSARGFTHTYLMDTDGNIEEILGDPIEIDNYGNFLTAMNNGDTDVYKRQQYVLPLQTMVS